jgi:gas vesicle protein
MLGAALGLLFAPSAGLATREKIAAKFNEFQTKEFLDVGLNRLAYIIEEAKAAAQAKKEELERTAEVSDAEDKPEISEKLMED